MTFALYELALNPDVQEKMREEVNAVLKKHDNKLTYEAMLEMKYLQMVIDGENLFFFLKIFMYFGFDKQKRFANTRRLTI